MKKSRFAYGSATGKQLRFIGRLCEEVAPEVHWSATVRRFGGPDNIRSLSRCQASLLIEALLAESPRSATSTYDPGEDAADRWAESQVGI